MDKKVEEIGLKSLKKIQGELEEIKVLQSSLPRTFISGLLYGAGAIVGSIIAVAAIGWILSILGILPGFGDIANYLTGLVNQFNAARH